MKQHITHEWLSSSCVCFVKHQSTESYNNAEAFLNVYKSIIWV